MDAEPLKLLVIGQLNHIHVAHMARAMANRGFDIIVAGPVLDGYGEKLGPESSLRTIELRERSGHTFRGVASQIRSIRRLVREHRPDVVHAHWLCGNAAFAALAGASPLVATAWGSDVLRASRAQRLANRIALRRSAIATAESPEMLDAMVALGAPRERVAYVHWGVDLEQFTPPTDRAALRARLGLPRGRLLLSPRTLLPLYNPRVIIEAFRQVAERIPDAHLVLLTLYESDYDLGSIPFPDRIHVVGRVPYELMPDYLGAADACVSIPSSDGSPRTVFEAMACGSPVVVSDLPWLRGVLDPGHDVLVTPIDAGAVADAILGLLTNPDCAAEIARNARERVEKDMSSDAQMDKLAELLRMAAATHTKGTRSPLVRHLVTKLVPVKRYETRH